MNRLIKNKFTLSEFTKKWLPVFLWAVIIFWLSSIEQIVVSQFFIWDFIAKKIAHLTEYAVLFALIFRATRGQWILSFVLTMVYAASDEIHQKFVPGRTAAFYDLAFDFSGASLAGYLIWKFKQTRRLKPKK